jgi:hypothetical protein
VEIKIETGASGSHFMRNILHRGPRFAAFLLFLPALVFVASLLWQIGPASAVQTYYYQGPAYSPASTGGGTLAVNGSISGKITFAIPAGYSGSVGSTGILSYNFSASGIGSVTTGGYYNAHFWLQQRTNNFVGF